MAHTKSLDEVLEAIMSYCVEARQLNSEIKSLKASQKTQIKVDFDESKEAQLLIVPENAPVISQQIVTKKLTIADDLNLCCICFENNVETLLPCFHSYCYRCIDDWKLRDPTCPMCRQRNSNSSQDAFNFIDEKISVKEEIRIHLVKELTRIISELIGEKVIFNAIL